MDKQKITVSGLYLGLLVLTAAVFFALGVYYDTLRGDKEYNTLVVYQPVEQAEGDNAGTDAEDISSGREAAVAVPGSVPLNTATKEELMTVPGIGETFAERIIAYRETSGGFEFVEELMEVEGIGEGRYASWAPYFTLDEISD